MNETAHTTEFGSQPVSSREPSGSTEMERDAERALAWRKHLAIFAASVLAALALFDATYWSMVTTWWRSETFAHGFIVVPISAYLAWRKRGELFRLWPRPVPGALGLLALLGLVWLFGQAADVLGITQLAATAMIPALVILVFGWGAARLLAFPLAFLFLAVPIGEFLVPPLIDFTAWFTVHALQWSGIPVYWEGTRFSLPTGDWSVVKACSGVRYLYATLTVALLYVYLTYRSRGRQVAFVLLAVVLAIIANGLRAYGIVMIGHVSDMRLAVGVDHFIYGWVFFALLMVVLFWIGSLMREDEQEESDSQAAAGAWSGQGAGSPTSKALVAGLAGIVVMAAFPAWAGFVQSRAPDEVTARLVMPHLQGGWHHEADEAISNWSPVYTNPTAVLEQRYEKDGAVAGLHIAYYGAQQQGSELISFQNVLVQEKEAWHIVGQRMVDLETDAGPYRFKESHLRSHAGELLAWQWYWVNGSHLSSIYLVKVREAIDKLISGHRRGAGVIVYTPVDGDLEAARATLGNFARHAVAPVDRALTQAASETR